MVGKVKKLIDGHDETFFTSKTTEDDDDDKKDDKGENRVYHFLQPTLTIFHIIFYP